MTTAEDLSAMIAEIEQQMATDQPMFDALQTSLEDCDPREQFAVAMDRLPELPLRPIRTAPPRPVLSHFIRALDPPGPIPSPRSPLHESGEGSA